MAVQPDHWLWSRQRPEHHGGAMRTLEEEDDEDGYPRGPDASPRVCPQCDLLCGSVSPGQASWYLSSSASSSPESEDKPLCKSTRVVSRSWLHMEGRLNIDVFIASGHWDSNRGQWEFASGICILFISPKH